MIEGALWAMFLCLEQVLFLLNNLKPISVLNQKLVCEQTERNRCKQNRREKQFKSNKM